MITRILPLMTATVLVMAAAACTAEPEEARGNERVESANPVEVGGPRQCDTKPVPRKRRVVKAVAFARGDGPAFVGLGTPDVVRYRVGTKEHNGWYYYKTLWAIAPSYGGEVVITGRQVDGSGELRFNPSLGFPGDKRAKLLFAESDTHEWRYGPSATLIRADGCYAFRIEGDGFVDWVTFIARS